MPILKIETAGQYGVIDDLEGYQLPPNAWSDGRNIRFNDGKAVKMTGHEEFFDPNDDLGANWDGGAADQVYYLLPVAEGSDYYWIFCGLKDVGVYDASTGTAKEITRAAGDGGDYTATDASVDWTGCIIGGVPVLNNGVDDPQMWNPVDFGTPGTLEDLTAWPASTTCGAMRAYKNYLIAMDVTKSGTRYGSLVKWSDSSALGDVPASWDETDTTTDAGETELAGTRTDVNVGICLDGMALRDSFIIYKDDSIWSMNFVGGTFVFEFRKIYSAQGMLARRCMAEFEGKHFVVGQSDVFVHDGANFQSVIDSKRMKAFYDNVDPTYYDRTFVFANYAQQEMWVCFVENASGATWPNKAYVWNWRHNTWGERDLPSVTAHIEGGIVNIQDTADVWSTNDGTWADWTTEWGSLGFTPQSASPCMAGTGIVYKGDSSKQFAGTNMTSYVQRCGIPMGEQDQFMRIKAVYPRINGDHVEIRVGAQLAPGCNVDWGNLKTFTPGTDQKIDVRKTGTHAAVEIRSDDNVEWELAGIDIEFEQVSRR